MEEEAGLGRKNLKMNGELMTSSKQQEAVELK